LLSNWYHVWRIYSCLCLHTPSWRVGFKMQQQLIQLYVRHEGLACRTSSTMVEKRDLGRRQCRTSQITESPRYRQPSDLGDLMNQSTATISLYPVPSRRLEIVLLRYDCTCNTG
jgi:hypothetical protein